MGNGTDTNRDATGAKVYVTTSDGNRQVREQSGGGHNRGQNFPRLHFGLGSQKSISSIEVIWPNGEGQVFRNVAADRVIQLRQDRQQINTLFNYGSETPDLTVTGTTRDDTLVGSKLDNVLQGLAGDDLLKGLRGNDRLVGGEGKDRLIGGPGKDTLRGALGADEFTYLTKNQGNDVIVDFTSGLDRIVVREKGFKGGLNTGVLARERIVYGAEARDSRDRFIYNTQSELWFDGDGSGSQAAVLIAKFQNRPIVRSSDIFVI